MNEFWNWNDTSIIWQQQYWWLLVAFIIGCVVGWRFNVWKLN